MIDPERERAQSSFSWRNREDCLKRFAELEYDLLVVGGGVTGAGVARDAAIRGLKVALVERGDFASGTSSRSSKLIHGGVRYLENFEFHLVFEALSERSLLLKTNRALVRPLKFFFPVYKGDRLGMFKLSLGLWLYDLLALFRSPGFHRIFWKRGMLRQIPFLRQKDLKGGFTYYDASMWDDVLAVEILRSAYEHGADIANYVEAGKPIWSEGDGRHVAGFELKDGVSGKPCSVHAKKTIVCAGPWTDEFCAGLSADWKHWLAPSKGVHLIFDLKRIPLPGAMVMSQPPGVENDGRISFVIPRPDYGAGVVIVGTTDGPAPRDPARAEIDREDVNYLMGLLNRYFPDLHLKTSDILSGYVGVRPLMGATAGEGNSLNLQKVSREHHIGNGPGGTVVVAGGKYTTFRVMAEEIVDFAVKKDPRFHAGRSATKEPFNLSTTPGALAKAKKQAEQSSTRMPEELWERYGADAFKILEIHRSHQMSELMKNAPRDPDGFPMLAAQLRHAIRFECCLHLQDFYFRRLPLYASRADHGLPWAAFLGRVWAEERQRPHTEIAGEVASLKAQIEQMMDWKKRLP